MKIWHQSTVDLHGVRAGTWGDGAPSDFFGWSASYVIKLARHIMENAVRPVSEGYDACVIGSYTEPFLRERPRQLGRRDRDSRSPC